jgi:hypothetical protein
VDKDSTDPLWNCGAGQYAREGICTACPDGKVPTADKKGCAPCPEGEVKVPQVRAAATALQAGTALPTDLPADTLLHGPVMMAQYAHCASLSCLCKLRSH